MKVIVDMELCENHGQCAIAAPDVFRINDDGQLEYEQLVGDGLRDAVEEAVDVCPAQAITIGDQG